MVRSETISTKKPTVHGRPGIRYAVVGLGHIAQVAVLPAFAHAASNSQLTALVSGDPRKLKTLSARYRVPYTYSYAQFDQCLRDGHIDAVYIALPNSMHCDYATRAAIAGIHVLCEKPMAVTEQECREMIRSAERGRVKLMIAYRLHFEAANVSAVSIARSGKLGRVRMFNSVFALQVRDRDIRVRRNMGGGSLYDIGIYCINAARYLFQGNPIEICAFSLKGMRYRVRSCASPALNSRRLSAASARRTYLPVSSSAQKAACKSIRHSNMSVVSPSASRVAVRPAPSHFPPAISSQQNSCISPIAFTAIESLNLRGEKT
jgi:glucose-fructose oxidoreductase